MEPWHVTSPRKRVEQSVAIFVIGNVCILITTHIGTWKPCEWIILTSINDLFNDILHHKSALSLELCICEELVRPFLLGGGPPEPVIRPIKVPSYLGHHLRVLTTCNRGQPYPIRGCVCHCGWWMISLLDTSVLYCLFHLYKECTLHSLGCNLHLSRATLPCFNLFVFAASKIVLAAIFF